ncbi:MAG: PAS domain S-box protein [Coleofasciculaceae cyanobacterium]
MAHGNCFLWKPELVWLHAGSDFLIGLAYYSIPLMLTYFIAQRKDIPFPGLFLLFSAFILSCGTGHWLEIWTLWHPDYWLSGLMKGITAVISLYTASEMLPLIPKALALPSPAELEAANLALGKEVKEHQQTIEALKTSQQRLSLLVQQTPLAVIEWDVEGRVREWNPAAEVIFGYDKSEALGSHAAELVLPQCCAEQFESVWRNLLVCNGDSCCTNEHRTKENKIIFCDWYNTPLIDAQGNIVGFASLAQDVTKRKQAEEALRRANEELEDRVEERTKQLAQANQILHAEINERQLAESDLRESRKRLHTVVTQAPIILYATDSTGKITLVEGKRLERLGLEQSRLLGRSVFKLCFGERQTRENLRQVLEGNERAWTVKAEDSVYESRATPVRDNNNQVVGIIGVATDISQRHQVQSALAERERYLAALVEVQNQLLALPGDESCQRPILKMLGESAQASRVRVFKKSFDAGSDLSITQCGYWSALNFEKDNPQSESLLYDQFLPYWQDKLAQGEKIMGLVKDLPEPEKLILQHQGILAILVLPLIVRGQFFGLIVFENCTEAQVWSASAVDLLRAAAAALSLHQQRSQAEMALRISEAQLRERTTQQEQTLQELQQTQTQLVQSEKMSSLGMMVAGIAHEINNPVSFVYGNIGPASEYIQDLLKLISLYQQHHPQPAAPIAEQVKAMELDFLMEDLPKLLDSMKIGSERIRDLVVSLRTFSRLDEAEMKRVDIHEGLESTLMILQHRLKEKPGFPGIEVIKNYGNLPVVECYPGQLNQVFMNIIANAIDVLESYRINSQFARSRQEQLIPSHWIKINTEIVDSASNINFPNILIRIRDNGQGMTEEIKQRLFDPFFTTKPVGKGTGLGLSISYQIIVGKHQGQLQCVSELGQGTEFIIQIPTRQNCYPFGEKVESGVGRWG